MFSLVATQYTTVQVNLSTSGCFVGVQYMQYKNNNADTKCSVYFYRYFGNDWFFTQKCCQYIFQKKQITPLQANSEETEST